MRKLILLFVLLLTAAFVNAQDVNFNLSMTVEKFIEVTTSPIDWNLGTTTHKVTLGPSREERMNAYKEVTVAYANCPFTISVSGNNAANQGKPRFVRQETGANPGGFDVLPTQYEICLIINGAYHYISTDGVYHVRDAANFPISYDIDEAPHNGQVRLFMYASVNRVAEDGVPIKATLIDSSFGNIDSADAGLYECTMLMTLTAL